jgi:hypothetical protein
MAIAATSTGDGKTGRHIGFGGAAALKAPVLLFGENTAEVLA